MDEILRCAQDDGSLGG